MSTATATTTTAATTQLLRHKRQQQQHKSKHKQQQQQRGAEHNTKLTQKRQQQHSQLQQQQQQQQQQQILLAQRAASLPLAITALPAFLQLQAEHQQQHQQQQQHNKRQKDYQQKHTISNACHTTRPTQLPHPQPHRCRLALPPALKVLAIFTLVLGMLNSSALQISAAILQPQMEQSVLHPQLQQQQQQHPQQFSSYSNSNNNHNLLAHVPNHTLKSFSFIDDSTAEMEMAEMEVQVAANSQPIFDFGMPRNITGRTGQTEAIIKCRVDRLTDKSVSWIRKRDLHILTVGTATYTSDKRFEVTESKDAREWTLHVKTPQTRDSGIYECQVNTEPKMSMAFQLNVIEISADAKAIISGPHDLHFKVGSAIVLNCIVQQPSVKDIGPIYWYRGEHMITPFDIDNEDVAEAQQQDYKYADVAGELNALSEDDIAQDFTARIAMESQLGDTLKSRLRISNAQTTDTGNYTCQPTTASSASVMVHVINDENPAAMQKSKAVGLHGFPFAMSFVGICLPLLQQLLSFPLVAAATAEGSKLACDRLWPLQLRHAAVAGSFVLAVVSGCDAVLLFIVLINLLNVVVLMSVVVAVVVEPPVSKQQQQQQCRPLQRSCRKQDNFLNK